MKNIDAVDDSDPTTVEYTPLVINILINDADQANTKVTDIPSSAKNGTCSIVYNGAAVTYTPNAGFTGVDTCDYMICDDAEECCDTATITITVNEPSTNAPSRKPTPCPSNETAAIVSTPEPTTATPSTSPSVSPSEKPTDLPSSAPSYPYPCGVLPCDRASDLKEFYSTISDPATFDNPASPQALALDWITNHDSMMICPNDSNTCHTVQRYVMAVFYFSTEGYQWSSCSAPKDYQCAAEIAKANAGCDVTVTSHYSSDRIGALDSKAWLTPAHECSWGGVACWGENVPALETCLDQIDFEGNNLRGIIPDEIASLENMRYLALQDGSISGNIPSVVGSLGNLEALDLGKNELSGDIPEEIFGLTKLHQLELNNNMLTGVLSTAIGQLTKLQTLNVEDNSLNGDFPTEIGNLAHLENGFFSYNDYTGTVDAGICFLFDEGNLEKLQMDCISEVTCDCCTSCS